MKNLLAFGLFLALFACKNEQKPPVSPLLGKKPPIGIWLNDAYLNELNTTRSPLAAQKKGSVTSFRFLRMHDSLSVEINYAFHEGEALAMKPDGSNWKFMASDDISKKRYECLVSPDGQKIRLKTDSTEEVFSNFQANDVAAVQDLLVGGRYALKGQKEEVIIGSLHRIHGFQKFNGWGMELDYFGGPEQFDMIWFAESRDGSVGKQIFAFDFQGETLRLYETTGKDFLKKGRLKYELTLLGKVEK